MQKKGVEMSLNTIIIAAIGVLILLILAYLVVTYVSTTRKGLESCSVKAGGICKDTPQLCTDMGGTPDKSLDPSKKWDCEDKKAGSVCCKLLSTG
jgi:hypothetical protein